MALFSTTRILLSKIVWENTNYEPNMNMYIRYLRARVACIHHADGGDSSAAALLIPQKSSVSDVLKCIHAWPFEMHASSRQFGGG